MSEICDEGPYKGHSLDCHIFVCCGCGCLLPPGHCDCGFDARERLQILKDCAGEDWTQIPNPANW